MLRIGCLAVALLLGASVAHAASIEGYWYGKGYQPIVRKTMQWLTIINTDGTFSAEFREYDDCLLRYVQTEKGTWTVSAGGYISQTITVNGHPVFKMDDYKHSFKVLKLDDRKVRYVNEGSGQEWTAQRVTQDFKFPDCKYVS